MKSPMSMWPPDNPTGVSSYNFVNAIDESFGWSKTKDGHDYWLDVMLHLASISGYSDKQLKELKRNYLR